MNSLISRFLLYYSPSFLSFVFPYIICFVSILLFRVFQHVNEISYFEIISRK